MVMILEHYYLHFHSFENSHENWKSSKTSRIRVPFQIGQEKIVNLILILIKTKCYTEYRMPDRLIG